MHSSEVKFSKTTTKPHYILLYIYMGMINLTTNSFKNASAHANKNIGIKCGQVLEWKEELEIMRKYNLVIQVYGTLWSLVFIFNAIGIGASLLNGHTILANVNKTFGTRLP